MYSNSLRAALLIVTLTTTSAYAPPPGAISHWRGDVVVVTVKKVSGHDATNGKPPIVELEIHEILRGDAKIDRTRAVWQPRPLWNGECLVGVDVKKTTEAWEAKKLASPKVGDKFILWGEMINDKKQPQFGAFSWEAYPFSDENRTWAVKLIRDIEEQIRLQKEKGEAEKKAKSQALAEWRAKVTAEDLKKYAKEAEIVLVGKIVSWGNSDGTGLTFSARILKGENLSKPGTDKIFAEPALSNDLRDRLLNTDTEYLLFLKREGAVALPTHVRYPPIKSGEGIVIADQKAMEAVKAALDKK